MEEGRQIDVEKRGKKEIDGKKERKKIMKRGKD